MLSQSSHHKALQPSQLAFKNQVIVEHGVMVLALLSKRVNMVNVGHGIIELA